MQTVDEPPSSRRRTFLSCRCGPARRPNRWEGRDMVALVSSTAGGASSTRSSGPGGRPFPKHGPMPGLPTVVGEPVCAPRSTPQQQPGDLPGPLDFRSATDVPGLAVSKASWRQGRPEGGDSSRGWKSGDARVLQSENYGPVVECCHRPACAETVPCDGLRASSRPALSPSNTSEGARPQRPVWGDGQ